VDAEHLVEGIVGERQGLHARKDYTDTIGLHVRAVTPRCDLPHQLGGTHANDASGRRAAGQFGQAASVSTTDIEDAVALLDTERIHHAQILPSGFASHDERD